MPKIFSEQEKMRVRELSLDGLPNTEIAQRMRNEYPENWGSKYAHRTVARILKESEEESKKIAMKTLDEMSREERFRHIESRLQHSPRFKMAFKNFDVEEKTLFIDEYLSIIKSTDTLTEVEEQAVFAAVLEFVLAVQALNRKETEEKFRDMTMNGEIEDNDDPRFRRHVDDKYQREYDQHMKLYQKGMEQLKMSRQQRLKEVRSQKQTLVDLAETLSNKNAQAEVADEIERLSKLKDEELKKLLDLGHIHGTFEGF